MANQHGALPDPKATCEPATEEIVDIEFELLDVENDIVAMLLEQQFLENCHNFPLLGPGDQTVDNSAGNLLRLLQ